MEEAAAESTSATASPSRQERALARTAGGAGLTTAKKKTRKAGKAITPKQEQEIRECFKMLDDGDGTLSPVEFHKAMYALGFVPKDGESEDLFRKTDTNGSGTIEIDEFTALMSNYIMDKETKEYEAIQKLVNQIENEDKRPPLERLRALTRKMGEEVGDDELNDLLTKGIVVPGFGPFVPGFDTQTLFDCLYDSTKPIKLHTWYPGQRLEQIQAAEREVERLRLLAEAEEERQRLQTKSKERSAK